MTRPACLALLLAVLTPAAYPCEEFDDPEVQRAEYVLNHVYAKVWGQADTDGRELLDRAQLAWLEYRDASCAAAGMRDGVTAHDPFVTCVLFMTRGRTFELQLVGGTSQGSHAP